MASSLSSIHLETIKVTSATFVPLDLNFCGRCPLFKLWAVFQLLIYVLNITTNGLLNDLFIQEEKVSYVCQTC